MTALVAAPIAADATSDGRAVLLHLIHYNRVPAPTIEPAPTWRENVGDALRAVDLPEDAERWDDCGAPMDLACGECGHRRTVPFWCERSICPECARRHAAKLRESWERAMLALSIPGGWRWRLITLTLRVSGDIGADYARLRDSWGKLRDRWKRRYGKSIAGCAAFEIGANGNVHVHLLALTPWIDQRALSVEWLAITGDSSIVDVRLVQRGIRDGLRECTKYITKIGDREPAELARVYAAMRGKQSHRVWGALHGKVVKAEHPPVPCTECGCDKWWPMDVVAMLEREARPPP